MTSKVDQAVSCSKAFSFSQAAASNIPDPAKDSSDVKALAVSTVQKEISGMQADLEQRFVSIEMDIEKLEHLQAGILEKANTNVAYSAPPSTPAKPPSREKHSPDTSMNFFYAPPTPLGSDNRNDSSNNQEKNLQENGKPTLVKTLVIMDSNQKYLKSLWKNCEVVFSPTAQQLLPRLPYLLNKHKPELVLLHNGVNDLDTQDGPEVARAILQVVQRLKETSPNLKVVVSEVTPRKLNRDNQVQVCNEHLHAYFDPMEDVTIAEHSNLRTAEWEFYEDDKHLKQDSISKFAANLKSALRRALNIELTDKPKGKKKRKTGKKNQGNFEKLAMEFLQKLGKLQGK